MDKARQTGIRTVECLRTPVENGMAEKWHRNVIVDADDMKMEICYTGTVYKWVQGNLLFYFSRKEFDTMRYCPYCGAELTDREAPFCSECGKSLAGEAPMTDTQETAAPKEDGGGTHTKAGKSKRKQRKLKNPEGGKKSDRIADSHQPGEEEIQAADGGYDGYYDDVLPMDEGSHGEGIDRDLVKKIIGLAAGALVIVVACVAIMYLL